ncbi:isoprenylcysteine carboxylmethyltransferase family protein [Falsihalocynthiibacter sp. CO-5D18]|uniref:methyltransferase family protein n=1 Tax=Falsihalocynthiibacter sp. CO-5D18 TaxID=3240872 RepID=UPI00350FA488
MKGFPDLPPLWWLGSIGLIYLGKYLLPGWHFTLFVLNVVSWLFLVAALGLIGRSTLWFFRKKTPIEPNHQPKDLIVEGPYQLSRNPIYLALVMLTIASAIGHGSVLGIGAAMLLWKVLDRRFAEQYFKQTRRWF